MTIPTEGELNTLELNEYFVNEPPVPPIAPCYGTTLAQFRQRLRAMLSSYAPGTLIPNDPSMDLELQYINDGISMLWPHDYKVNQKSFPIVDGATRYNLPITCEFVMHVDTARSDISGLDFTLETVPHYDGWRYDNSYVDAADVTVPGSKIVWQDSMGKALNIVDPYAIGASSNYKQSYEKFLVVRYAEKWPQLQKETDCINPSGTRVNAVIFYAAHEYITSQFEVNSESIRYQNYMGIANRFYQQYMMMLVKDSKPLYIS